MALQPDIIVQYFIVREALNSKQKYWIKLPDALGGKACRNWTVETFTDSWETRKWPHMQQRAALSEAKWKTCDVAVSFNPQQGERKRMADIFRPSCSICSPPTPLSNSRTGAGGSSDGWGALRHKCWGFKTMVCLYLIPPATAASQFWWDQHVPDRVNTTQACKRKKKAWHDTQRKRGW